MMAIAQQMPVVIRVKGVHEQNLLIMAVETFEWGGENSLKLGFSRVAGDDFCRRES